MKVETKNMLRAVKALLFGCATGIITGVVVSTFLICARIASTFASDVYSAADTPIMILCLTTLVLLCCVAMATLQTLYPFAKGSGIPLAECCARGMLRVKWLRTVGAIIAGSILAFLSGMPVGGEGPSICVGGMLGDGVGKTAKQPIELRRYLVTGGASAGLAVAFNAPLTGVAFALEETHRRFSPHVLLASFSAVVPAVLVSRLMFAALGQSAYLASLGVGAHLTELWFMTQTEYTSVYYLLDVCAVAAIGGAVCGLVAVLFNRLVFMLGKLMGRIKFAALRLAPAFILTIIVGLFYPYFIGNCNHVVWEQGFYLLWWPLLLGIFALRFVMTVVAGGSKVTGGLFMPMIVLGALLGHIVGQISCECGLNRDYFNNVIMLCISAFFAASVRAPISAIAMAFELTGSFANLLPVTLAVAVATAVGAVTRTEPLYEKFMEELRDSAMPTSGKTLTVVGRLKDKAHICGKRIRDVLWPYNSLVTELGRGETDIVPDGETILFAGDVLTLRAERVVPDDFLAHVSEYLTFDTATDVYMQTPKNNN